MYRDCTIRVAKTKALISFAGYTVTAKLICVFVFAYTKSRFSHKETQIIAVEKVSEIIDLILHNFFLRSL